MDLWFIVLMIGAIAFTLGAIIFIMVYLGNILQMVQKAEDEGKRPPFWKFLLMVLPTLFLILVPLWLQSSSNKQTEEAVKRLEESGVLMTSGQLEQLRQQMEVVHGQVDELLTELTTMINDGWEEADTEQERDQYRQAFRELVEEKPDSLWIVFQRTESPSLRTELAAALGEKLDMDLGAKPGDVLSEAELARIAKRLKEHFEAE
ncbi:hypothetical protein KQI84_17580 [bacterium]|nr:hypothetical protein [bacterium]